MNEKELIHACKAGSEEAFREIYNRYWHRVFHFASLYIRDKEEIREIVQEVFIKLWQSLHSIRQEDNLKGFLFVITRNHIFNKSRSKHFNYDFYQVTVQNALEYSYDINGELDAKDLAAYIDKLIDQMPQQRRAVFTLSRKEYKTYKEIALMLNISEKTVERHINESIKYIKSNLRLLFFFF